MRVLEGALTVNHYLTAWLLLMRVNDTLCNARNRELRQYGINLEYNGTLKAVKQLGANATPGEIAKLRCRRPHTISTLLKNMEREGLVARSRDLIRRNVIRIALTEKGEKAILRQIKSAAIRETLSVLSQEEKEQLHAYIRILRGEAERKFAIDFRTKPYVHIGEREIDFQHMLSQIDVIVVDISYAVNSAEQEILAKGIEEPLHKNLVKSKWLAKCLSPDKLVQLREYLEIIRSQPAHKLDIKTLPNSYSAGELDSALWRKIRRTHDVIIRIRDKELANYGFSVKLASVLLAIKTLDDKATVGEIARWRLRSTATMSDFLKRLESQGLVKRLVYPGKSKRSKMVLTEKGEQHLARALQADSVTQIFSLFSQEELDQFCCYLKAILDRALQSIPYNS